MSETQFYTLVAIPLVGILMNAALFLYVAGRVDRLIDQVAKLETKVAVLDREVTGMKGSAT